MPLLGWLSRVPAAMTRTKKGIRLQPHVRMTGCFLFGIIVSYGFISPAAHAPSLDGLRREFVNPSKYGLEPPHLVPAKKRKKSGGQEYPPHTAGSED
jgi:hypothetical protein